MQQRCATPISRRRPTEGMSQLYLAGRGDRSYFDARTMYFYGFSPSDVQGELPIVHPVIDYDYVFEQPGASAASSAITII